MESWKLEIKMLYRNFQFSTLHFYYIELFFYRFKIAFTNPTNRANPIFRDIFEFSTWFDSAIRIT